MKRKWKNKYILYVASFLLVLLFRIGHYASQKIPSFTSDSRGYMNVDLGYLFTHFVSNEGQAPGYGFFLAIVRAFAGANYLNVVVAIQILLSFLSLFALVYTMNLLGINLLLQQVLLVLYGANPAICGWDGCILTESLSLSCTVFFLFFITRYIIKNDIWDVIRGGVIVFYMVFLRPQFLYIFAALLLFFLLKSIFEESKSRQNLKMVLLMACQTVLILLYCGNFKAVYGVFSLSDAMPRQNLKICIDRGYYKEFENQKLVKWIEDFQQGEDVYNENWSATMSAIAEFGNEEISQQTKACIRTHLSDYIKDTMDIIVDDTTTTFLGYGSASYKLYENINPDAPGIAHKIDRLQLALFNNVTVGQVLVVSLLEGIAMVYVWIKRKRLPWIHMALFAISMCTTWLTYFLTCFEYMRTMVSVLPYFYIMVGLFIQWVCTGSLPEREKKLL